MKNIQKFNYKSKMINDFKKENELHLNSEEKTIVRNISYEMDTGKHFFIDNQGNYFHCNIFGISKPNFRYNISGFINGRKRKNMKNSKSLSDLLISEKNKLLKENKNLYLPSLNKFEGYAQFPRPICSPFENVQSYLMKKSNKKELKNSCEQSMENEDNKNLFKKEEGNKGLSYITSDINGTVNKREGFKTFDSENDNSLKNYNKDKKILINLIDNTNKEYKNKILNSSNDRKDKEETVRALFHLKKKLLINNGTNLINGRKLEEPNKSMINEYKIINKKLFNDIKSTNNILNQHKSLIRSFSNIDSQIKQIMNKNKPNNLNIITGRKLLNKISINNDKINIINFKKKIIFPSNSNLIKKRNLNRSEESLRYNLLNISRNKNSSDYVVKSSFNQEQNKNNNKIVSLYEELETKESLSSKPWNKILFPIKSTSNENIKSENLSFISDNCNIFKFNKSINFLKNLEKKSNEEKKLLEGYKKIEPKKIKQYDSNDDGPKYKDFSEIYRKELETLEKCNPIIFELQKKNNEKDIAKFKKRKEFKKLIEKNIMKGKTLKIKKTGYLKSK